MTAHLQASGGSQPSVSARLSSEAAFNSGDTVVFDATVYDSGGLYNPATGVFTIPVGLGGEYLITANAETSTSGTTGLQFICLIGGAADNGVLPGAGVAGTFDIGGALVRSLAAGDTVQFRLNAAGAAGAYTFGAGSTGATLNRLGDTPA